MLRVWFEPKPPAAAGYQFGHLLQQLGDVIIWQPGGLRQLRATDERALGELVQLGTGGGGQPELTQHPVPGYTQTPF